MAKSQSTPIKACQKQIGYSFADPSLLTVGLTHTSAAVTRNDSNERLEFLGDAVLGMCVCDMLYDLEDELDEGDMTKIKSTVVSRKTCARIVFEEGFDAFAIVGSDIGKGHKFPESVAAGLIEGIIGAIYIDGGFDPAEDFIEKYFRPFIDVALETSHQDNFKSLLQQFAQQEFNASPHYILLDEKGPDHSKCFEIAVSINGQHYPASWAPNKKDAEQMAAKRALQTLGVLDKGK
ncbi:MAG: ribonuclease III [Phycisphaerales bacterium]|jgi:ribonuclease III|nr:ribonuclease III [Phycisphaerales bacterium]MBT7171186.1 ribonuclease III [Phycisphaerales bacterium]